MAAEEEEVSVIKAKCWRISTPTTNSGWAWDVIQVTFYDENHEKINLPGRYLYFSDCVSYQNHNKIFKTTT